MRFHSEAPTPIAIMLFAEPPRSPADWNFALFGIPVRVHVFFWILCLVSSGSLRGEPDIKWLLSWTVAVFISILVHEMGHAVTQIYYGGSPWIVLHAFGGLAICSDCDRRPMSQILISLAGPAAGFLLAGLILVFLAIAGHPVSYSIGPEAGSRWFVLGYLSYQEFDNDLLRYVVNAFLYINILWGLINLLPVYPLDGGRISRELFTLQGDVSIGIARSLWVSIIVAAGLALFALSRKEWFVALLFGYLAYSSYQSLESYQRFGGRNRGW